MIKEITSTKNETYKFIKSLKTKKARIASGKYTVEGIKSVKDAIAAGADIDFLVLADNFDLDFYSGDIYKMPENFFAPLCDTETPQGVLAVINIPKNTKKEDSLYLFCDHVTDPGNMGTIIRICDAVNCSLLLSCGCVDIYNPKTVRASMGSLFHTSISCDLEISDLESLKQNGYHLICGALSQNTCDYKKADYSKKTVIIVGNEANGVSEEVLKLSDECVKIPIWGRAESLNVGVAAALLLYEAKQNQE